MLNINIKLINNLYIEYEIILQNTNGLLQNKR